MAIETRVELTELELADALKACAREPIHIPGSIQPYGVLFVVQGPEKRIVQISENVGQFIPGLTSGAALGMPLCDVIGDAQAAEIDRVIIARGLLPIQSTVIQIGEHAFDAVAHRVGADIVVELEVFDDPLSQQQSAFFDELRDFAIGLRDAIELPDLFELVATKIRKITGFDRVKLYRFDEQWNGEVVGESRADFMPSYLGLHFPASDIPEQARKLYMTNFIRQIADVAYAPVPIIPLLHPDTQLPLDMSLSVLRSVSPIHVQYLVNMNIQASMSISIVQDGKLWGLVACHHGTGYHVPFRIRIVAEIMGHIFSAQLSSLEGLLDKENREKRNLIIERLSAGLETEFNLARLLKGRDDLARDALNAHGMAVVSAKRVLRFGLAPDNRTLSRLADWVRHQSSGVYSCQDAQVACVGVPGLETLRGGFLAAQISHIETDVIIWFRDSVQEQVGWAGPPEKLSTQTKAGYRLLPRSSFELWKEEVKHRSMPWTPLDVETARTVVQIVLEGERKAADYSNLAKSDFLANMSHELRTPMSAIIGIVSLLDRGAPLDARQQKLLSVLKLSSDTLLTLINDLLDFAKIESGELVLETVPANVADVISAVASIMNVRVVEKGLELTISGPERSDLQVLCDAGRLQQIVSNLVSNAVKFTSAGAIRIETRSVPMGDAKVHVEIDVTDTGIGMTLAQCERIFGKFVQADATISRRYGGTGLGLSISKQLAELMGGTIVVHSVEGVGTRFTLAIDFMQNETEPSNRVHEIEGRLFPISRQPPVRVLLAEDYEGNIIVATAILEEMGCEVVVAHNGADVLHLLETGPFDMILMDVQMPGVDGYEATSHIRANERAKGLRRIPIIGVTANAMAGDRQKSLGAGMDDYISKPYTDRDLRGTIKNHLVSSD